MKLATKFAAVALLAASTLGASAASAAVVCNAQGFCWHTRQAYEYRPEFGVTVHEDGWKWGSGDKFRWREHGGRGYWRDGRWVKF